MPELLDDVTLATPVNGYPEGTAGTIVDAYPKSDHYTVELFDDRGETLDVVVCSTSELTT